MLDEGLHAGLGFLGIRSRTVMYAEREAYPVSVLEARMEEGSLPPAPVWFGDLCELDASQFHGVVDCIAAGFPCQDLSLAGRRAGLDGKRSGLFFEVVRIARDCGARYLFLENVAGIASATASVVDEAEGALDERAAARVLGELADLGWHAEWATLSASDVGASHGRSRWFCWAWRMDDASGHRTPEGQNDGRSNGTGTGEAISRHGALQGCEVLGQPESFGRPAWGTEHAGQQGRAAFAVPSGELAHPQRSSDERRGNPGNLACAGSHIEGEARQRGGPAADGCGCAVADTSSKGFEGREQPGALHGNRGGAQAHGPTEQLCRPLFAPGPADPAWPGIIQQWPHLAPALEPSFHSMADGLAYDMDDCRPQRLKCCGNGVVAAQAAFALVGLVWRMKT